MTQDSTQANSERGPAAVDGLRDDPDRPTPLAPKPWILDAFCGAGGAAMGYHRAGFKVVGVDIAPQPMMDVVRRGCDDLVVREEGVR